jgi:anti-sigma factor RsiW
MPTNYDKERAEECRHEVRHHLATCSTVARDVAAIRRAVNKSGNDY